jgi:hypothetical protein
VQGSRSIFIDDLIVFNGEPAPQIPNPPTSGIARYINTGNAPGGVDEQLELTNDGYQEGNRRPLGEETLALLMFGEQFRPGGAFGYGQNLSDDDIVALAKKYVDGFNGSVVLRNPGCITFPGSPPCPATTTLILAIGTSSGGFLATTNPPVTRVQDAQIKGTNWANLVNRVQTELPKYDGLNVTVSGAIDIEFASGFGTLKSAGGVDEALGWTTNFQTAAGPRRQYYINFGSANGCNLTGRGPCDGEWTQDDYWKLTTGGGNGGVLGAARGLPQIYNEDAKTAKQWSMIGRIGVLDHPGPGSRIDFFGSLTQLGSCTQDAFRPGCGGNAKNSPQAGWTQFKEQLSLPDGAALNPANPGVTSIGQRLGWALDILWQADCRTSRGGVQC